MFTRIVIFTFISSIIFTFDVIDKSKTFYPITKDEREIPQEPNITKIKDYLESNGFVLIQGKDMKNLLLQHGASREDIAVLESGYIHKHLPIDQQPAMHHRLVNVKHRYFNRK